jgi:hypothetical protein
MLTAIATGAFCSPNTAAPRRLPKQVTDFVARTMSERPSDNPCTDGRKLTPAEREFADDQGISQDALSGASARA